MAILTNKIGPFSFVSLSGPPQTPHERSDVIQRPGVNGTGFVKTGKKGEPFDVETRVDVADWATANAVAADYKRIVNAGTYDVIFAGVNYSSAGVKFVVNDVQITSIKKMAKSAGGLNAGLAVITARWRLFSVIVS